MSESPFTKEELEQASRYRIVIHWSDIDQIFVASLPELDDIKTHGSTPGEAADKALELAADFISGLRELGQPVPAPELATIS